MEYVVNIAGGQALTLSQTQYDNVVFACSVAGVLGCFLIFWLWTNLM